MGRENAIEVGTCSRVIQGALARGRLSSRKGGCKYMGIWRRLPNLMQLFAAVVLRIFPFSSA